MSTEAVFSVVSSTISQVSSQALGLLPPSWLLLIPPSDVLVEWLPIAYVTVAPLLCTLFLSIRECFKRLQFTRSRKLMKRNATVPLKVYRARGGYMA